MADNIYKLWKDEDGKIRSKILINADLNFDKSHPIETTPVFETENIKKIYWIDGKNQARFINIEADTDTITANGLNFVPTLSLQEQISITKVPTGRGKFPSGTIQYAFTYFNTYGQESNIIYLSDIYYNSHSSRGGSPEESVGNCFKIEINSNVLDTTFNYIRIYSIIRTTTDNKVLLKKIIDLNIIKDRTEPLIYIDTGEYGEILSDTHLFYIGGEPLLSKTICQKDNTLFLGNISLFRKNAGSIDVGGGFSRDILQNNARITWSTGKSLYSTSETNTLYGYSPHLDKSQKDISFFKKGNYYRFGIQFQHISGKWSEPIFLDDSLCTANVSTVNSSGTVIVTGNTATANITNIGTTITALQNAGYIKARGVVVYPKGDDRVVVCQGILNPTVFNVSDRYNGNPYVVSSWFARPVVNLALTNYYNKGSLLEYRHYNQLPPNSERNSEVEGTIDDIATGPIIASDTEENKKTFVDKYKENFFIDASIVTFNSPELEWDDTIDTIDESEFDLYIVGAVNLTGHASDIYVDANPSESPNGGFHKKTFNVNNINTTYGGTVLANVPLWSDRFKLNSKSEQYEKYIYDNEEYTDSNLVLAAAGLDPDELTSEQIEAEIINMIFNGSLVVKRAALKKDDLGMCYYPLYPWNSLAPLSAGYEDSDETPSKLIQKKIANLRYAAYNSYLSNPINCGEIKIKLFNSDLNNIIRVNANNSSFTYQGNVDKIVMPSLYYEENVLDKSKGWPKHILTFTPDPSEPINLEQSFNLASRYTSLDDDSVTYLLTKEDDIEEMKTRVFRHNPTRITFNSSPHAVFQLKDKKCLPNYNNSISGISFWGDTINSTEVASIAEAGFTPSNYLWLAELRRNNVNVSTLFGGKNSDAYEANIWLSAGDAIPIDGTSISIDYTVGDTYLQRYDCLKTYPRTIEDTQTMVEIVSFLCETSINIDGRYDKNRGDTSNLVMTPKNFNLLNKNYTQSNNYFTYNGLNYTKFDLNEFPNTITWTDIKTPSELIDKWTNLNFVNTIDADGTYGKIKSLNLFDNEIYGFQDQGVFQLMYNSRVQIAPSDGVPIELGTADTVLGKRYISTMMGSKNKWAICETPKGLYFVDELSKAIFILNKDGVINLSTTKGFRSWMADHLKNKKEWTPESYLNFTAHFDKIHSNIYFVDYLQCLNFNETLGEFTSFFNYEGTPFMFNIWDKFIMVKNNKLWEYGAGDYNQFFGETKPYYTKFIANQDFLKEKIFTNLEFIADSYDSDNNLLYTIPYDYIKVSTHLDYDKSYQFGTTNLTEENCQPSSAKQKFRVWRTLLPRSISTNTVSHRPNSPHKFNKDRIRNPWLYLELGNNQGLNTKTNLHSLLVYYTD